jgi:mannosyltransferase OCH1-like enzyme
MDIDIANMTAEEFLKFAPNYFRDFRLLIPPIIHQIWFGEISSEIKMMMETFSKEYTNKYPGWRYILWTEEKLNNLDMINKDLFMKEKKYDAKSDIARLEILNRFGGWYLDSDFVWLGDKPLSSLISVVKNGFIISYEKNGTKTGSRFLDKDTTRVANGFLGSTISNPIIAFIIGQMRESYGVNQNEGAVICSGPDFVQSCLDSISGIDISILDHKHFFPAWWCLDKQRNTSYDEHIQNTSISIAELGKKYPSSIAYHMGFTSKNEYSHGNEL